MMPVSESFKEQFYLPVHGEVTDSELPEGTPFIESKSCQRSHFRIVGPWILSTVSLAVITAYLLLQQRVDHWHQCFAATSPAFRTDLGDSHPHVFYEERVFSGRLWYDDNTDTIIRDIDPSEPQYFGLPTPEIDAAWADLLRGEFVRLTAEEAAPFTPELRRHPDTNHYYFEPDMFHSLHCLNAVRMELDSDYYSKHNPHSHLDMEIKNSTAFPPDWDRIHIDHCLDQLRQSIQCQGDLSPVPLYFHKDVPVGLGVGQTHTCRNWESMRSWMNGRKELHKQNLNW